MKSIYFFIILNLLIINTFAQKTNIVVFSEGGERFWLIINGIKQNAKALQNVKVTDLPGNAWKIKVTFENQDLKDLDQTTYRMENVNQELTYQIKKNRKKQYVLRPFSYQNLNEPDTNPQNPQITDNQLIIPFQIKPLDIPPPPPSDLEDENKNTSTKRTQPCNFPVNSSSFGQFKTTFGNQSFEETKLKLAKQFASNNCLSADQVREVVKSFSFESSRLDFAKFAYDYTYDRNNYYKLSDAFDFSSSVDDLMKFIESKK